MTAPELHADDLLDKEARGELTSAERVRLEEHVEACSVCRFERQVRDDFRLEFEALGKAARKGKGARTSRGLVSRRMRLTLLAAAAVLVTGAAAAEWETIKRTVFSSYVMEQSHAPAQSPATTSGAHVAKNGSITATGPEQPLANDAPAIVEAPPIDSAIVPAPSASEVAKVAPAIKLPAEARTAASRPPTNETTAPAPEIPEVAPVAPAPATADALFAAANEARQSGAYAEAIRSYLDLAQRFPQSPEAVASHAIVGRLLLDRGDPSSALEQFDVYMQSGMTTLGEEARVGRALALERLGRSSEEADAWASLLTSYPQSVHASRARSRLAKLGNR
jgi:TolA-binding protein